MTPDEQDNYHKNAETVEKERLTAIEKQLNEV